MQQEISSCCGKIIFVLKIRENSSLLWSSRCEGIQTDSEITEDSGTRRKISRFPRENLEFEKIWKMSRLENERIARSRHFRAFSKNKFVPGQILAFLLLSRCPFPAKWKCGKSFRVPFAASGGFSDYFSFCQSFAFYFHEQNTQFVFKRLKIYLYLCWPQNKFANGFCLPSIFRVGKNGKSNKLNRGEEQEVREEKMSKNN